MQSLLCVDCVVLAVCLRCSPWCVLVVWSLLCDLGAVIIMCWWCGLCDEFVVLLCVGGVEMLCVDGVILVV